MDLVEKRRNLSGDFAFEGPSSGLKKKRMEVVVAAAVEVVG